MNSKKTSKSFIRIFGNSNHKKELLGLMRYRFNHYEELFSYIEKKANKLKNPITYKDLLEYLDLSGTFDEQFFIKPEKRTDLINKSLQRALKAVKLSKKLPKAFTYLDIGAGDASKTDSIRKMLDLSPKQSYCLDLNETPFDTSIESSICNYVLYDGGSDIPFPNNKFNAVKSNPGFKVVPTKSVCSSINFNIDSTSEFPLLKIYTLSKLANVVNIKTTSASFETNA